MVLECAMSVGKQHRVVVIYIHRDSERDVSDEYIKEMKTFGCVHYYCYVIDDGVRAPLNMTTT